MAKNKTTKKKQIPADKAEEYQNYMIDVLCHYKSFKPEEKVYLTEENFYKAHEYVMNIQKMMDPQMLKNIQKQMPQQNELNPGSAKAAVEDLKDQFDME